MNTIELHEKPQETNYDLIKCTASLVAAYVSRNAVGVGELPVLIDQVHTAISVLQGATPGSTSAWTGPTAAQIEASIGQDGLIADREGDPARPQGRLNERARPCAGRIPVLGQPDRPRGTRALRVPRPGTRTHAFRDDPGARRPHAPPTARGHRRGRSTRLSLWPPPVCRHPSG